MGAPGSMADSAGTCRMDCPSELSALRAGGAGGRGEIAGVDHAEH